MGDSVKRLSQSRDQANTKIFFSDGLLYGRDRLVCGGPGRGAGGDPPKPQPLFAIPGESGRPGLALSLLPDSGEPPTRPPAQHPRVGGESFFRSTTAASSVSVR